MSKTRRSDSKDKRPWNELLSEKKKHIERRAQEDEAKKSIRDVQKLLKEMYPEEPPF